MATYVIGDVHGCFTEWLFLKNMIEKEDSEAKLVLTGDIIDRGEEVYKMILWAMKNITPDGKYQMVLGNHEEMKINWWNNYKCELNCLLEDKKRIYGNYYECTLDYRDFNTSNYDFSFEMSRNNLGDAQVEEIITFFNELPLYKEFDIDMGIKKQHFIIVHGGIEYGFLTKNETVRKKCLTEHSRKSELKNFQIVKNRKEMLWGRSLGGYDLLKKSIIVHGHTPTIIEEVVDCGAVPGQIYFSNKCINVDCGEVYRNNGDKCGNLAAIRLEDLKEYYVHFETRNEHPNSKINQERKKELLLPRRVY